ncbi:MAG: excinuclease ABC subunit UvrC [Candidatus Omnitrophica bacterium]|nr:excinuclease ABC subunit UvrC [Candidatus Omnitrophota bacterium]
MVKKEEIGRFPGSPGVYLMKDKSGEVIYVGKALSLKKRVASYFLKSLASIKTQVMMASVDKVEYIETPSEYDALILEDRLVKQYKPRFNISLKDDKSFPYIKVTREEFPRVFIGRRDTRPNRTLAKRTAKCAPFGGGMGRYCRKQTLVTPLKGEVCAASCGKDDEDADYFGPYISAKLLRRALAILRKGFPFCSCRRFPKKTCLHYHLELCPGPCQGKISRKRYLKIIRGLEDFLTKKDSDLIEEMSRAMRALVKEERFEEAARVRDRLEALSVFVSLKKIDDRKVIAIDPDLKRLGLKKEPVRVETFDISNISGKQAVGSMVSFCKGKPDKDNYRRFKIRKVSGIDDYAMMREVVRRRYERLLVGSAPFPDLIVIDGGKGHLDAAQSVLKELKADIPIIAIAKSQDLIYTVYQKLPVKLGRDSVMLRLIQRARDEAHRFALKYHRLLRTKDAFEKS